jgi:hypothetical protein
MKKSVLLSVTIAGLLAGCGGDDRNVAAQQPYETVQEGSVAGVTTTIQGPGETLPPITGTNADTTTAFTLNPNAVPPAQSTMAAGAPSSSPGVPPYDPAPSYTPPPVQQAPRRETPSTPPPVRSAEREPAVTPPPATETTATTTPAEPERTDPPAETDTTVPQAEDDEPPPPPPTTTDTAAPPTTTDGR